VKESVEERALHDLTMVTIRAKRKSTRATAWETKRRPTISPRCATAASPDFAQISVTVH
jgi:hypothetical protein